MKTWGLRAAGWMAMFMGLNLMTRILYTLGRCQGGSLPSLLHPHWPLPVASSQPFRPDGMAPAQRPSIWLISVSPLHSLGMREQRKAG